MKVYLVRHGQSIFNKNPFENKTHQFPDTPLSDGGLKQASYVANRFSTIPIDIIYSSSYKRALQTAEEVNQKLGKEIITTDLLIERKNPSTFLGKDRLDPEIIEVKKIIREKSHDKDWHYSDEENFYDFKNRAMQFLAILEKEKYENVLVVSHGFMITMLTLCMVFGSSLDHEIYFKYIKFAHTTNTGISMFEYKDENWRLLTWNDYAHLGEV